MKRYYKKDLKSTYLILEGNEEQKEDYQIAMLRGNDIPGVLKTQVRHVDNQSQYYYDISGKVSFETFHERVGLGCEEMKRLVSSLLATIEELQTYMLDANCLLLSPEYIFFDEEGFYFCYYPFYKEDAKEEFHRLTEFFVREVNYQDEEGVQFAYTLHKSTMEENYSVEQIMKKLECEPEEQEEEKVFIPPLERKEETVEEKAEDGGGAWELVRRLLERTRLVKRE